MDIIWHGYSCFTIKNKNTQITTNPFNEDLGLKLPKLKGDILVLTNNNPKYSNQKAVEGEPYVVDCPGEYEVKGVSVKAFQIAGEKGFFFNLLIDGVKVCFMEKVGAELDDELIDNIGDVDVLLISIGDESGLNANTAHKIIEKIEPRCVIPMNYSVEGATEELQANEAFLKMVGAGEKEPVDKFSAQGKSSFREDTTDIVVLKAT